MFLLNNLIVDIVRMHGINRKICVKVCNIKLSDILFQTKNEF